MDKSTFNINNTPVYESLYVEDDKIYRGKNSNNQEYIILSPNTFKVVKQNMKVIERKNKINKINKNE